ncbi:chitin synthase chs-2-like [Acipenser ruthenus]|uniref:chitin synthase chs-2-like n=1 Tax=Acipenser ruthenus TaxID=7906 RepID=UPI002741480A|nr:chitin synthase chs-2-like [Acipenser ruthenus]
MEEQKDRSQKREKRHEETWDPFQLNPIGAEKERKRRGFVFLQHLFAFFVGLFVLVSAFFSKGSLLVLTTMASENSLIKKDRTFHLLMVACSLAIPNVLLFLKSLWKCAFKNFVAPKIKTMLVICLIESLVSFGTSLLALVAMPHFDILTSLFILGSVCFFSSIFQAAFHLQKKAWKIIFPICSVVFVLAGYILLGLDYYIRSTSTITNGNSSKDYLYVGLGIFASILVSLNWWENAFQAGNKLDNALTELEGFRDFVFMISSILRTAVIGIVFAVYITIEGIDWSVFSKVPADTVQRGVGLFLLQAFASAVCHWFGVVGCKIHAVRCSFALPVVLTTPAVVIAFVASFMVQFNNILENNVNATIGGFCLDFYDYKLMNTSKLVLDEISNSICHTSVRYNEPWGPAVMGLEGLCWWVGLLCSTYYIWTQKLQRIERTTQIFVRRLYEAAFIDQSLLLNTRMKIIKERKQESGEKVESCLIYLCATMWHETYDEMLKILTSMFRLDRYRGDAKEQHKDNFDFECHIFVDDSFEKDTCHVNKYVNDLVSVIIEVYRVFTNKEPDEVSIFETPYGGRLACILPEGNMLYIHLKDKQLIRNKKRWSQIMYMYYLLGWKGYITNNPQRLQTVVNPCRASLVSMNGNAFILPQDESDNKRKDISDDNTYIMALDGDTDFHPSALILLVDRLRMYQNVGAACGRIHPTGMGPMVWYQKFEYAVGHWLQKTAEHVFGSVLCSPGCFSLFRGSALMDDNVLKRYTTTATKASEYVQYDQGEDRWLCTLLLQQGWRVEYNAASDAYTNAPQEFNEFYNQRRRWGPSTLANTLDLLHSGAETSKRNSSISRAYIFYQIFTVGSSILGPASVCLMIAGAFSFVFNWDANFAIVLSVIPPAVYIIICYTTKPSFQLTVAAILSVLYAFLMTATFLSIIGQMVKEKTFITPSGLFLVSATILYVTTAILHPQEFGLLIYGLMYVICIPSGYLLLSIYSLVNLHIVSWGTRESTSEVGKKKTMGVVCDKKCTMCCWDIKIEVNQETENVVLQKLQQTIQQTNLNKQQNLNNLQEIQLQTLPRHGNEAARSESEKSDEDENVNENHSRFEDEEEQVQEQDGIQDIPESVWIKPVQEEFLKKLTYANLKRNLAEQIKYVLRDERHEDVCDELVLMLTDTLNQELYDTVGPEDILPDSLIEDLKESLNVSARRILAMNEMEILQRRIRTAIEKTLMAPQVEKLSDEEHVFWIKLIERYLEPLSEDQTNKEEVQRELKSLRNKATFLYFIVNVLWVVATFFLQAIGEAISIKIPKVYPNGTVSDEYLNVEPIGLMFLLTFAVLLIVQFLAMLYHRVYTLIHVVSYRSKEKEYNTKDSDDEGIDGLTITNDLSPIFL